MLPAATKNCLHQCPQSDGTKPHVGFEITEGEETVLIENKIAACQGHALRCSSPSIPVITSGSKTVFFCGKKAARKTDQTSHAGIILQGAGTVFIGG